MRRRTLRRILKSVLQRSVVSPVAIAIGCGGGADLSLFTSPACEADHLSFGGVVPASPVDYIELRRGHEVGAPEPHAFISGTGKKCEGAADKPACEAAVASAHTEDGFNEFCGPICLRYYLVTTKGAQVSTVTELRGFLGTIDGAQEAALLAWSEGYQVSCGERSKGGVRIVDGGFEVIAARGSTCGPEGVTQYILAVDASGKITERSSSLLEDGDPNCVIGRRPEGLVRAEPCSGGLVGAWFADAARLEGASVTAFEILARELVAHDAPSSLVDAARRAARDEVRHTRSTAALARRFGGVPAAVEVEPRPLRSLEALALDNATEGCVRETYGALVGGFQAARAGDRGVRRVMRGIAPDEERHAELAARIAEWAEPKLEASARRRVEDARGEAFEALARALDAEPPFELQLVAGLPSGAEARALLAELRSA